MNAHIWHLFESAARHPDWIDPLGWILVHSLWQFALVAIVLATALRVMARSSSAVRYAAALAALTAMVLLPAATWFALPHTATIPLRPADAAAANSAKADSATTSVVAADSLAASHSQPLTSSTTDSRTRRGRRPAGPTIAESPRKGDVTFPPLQEAALESPTDDGFETAAAPAVFPAMTHVGWRQRLESWLPTIVWGWLVGVLLFALRPIWSAWTVWQLRRTGTAATSAELADLFQRTTAKLGLRREVRLLQSAVMQVPAVIGYLRPVVLVPISVASGFPPEQLEALFAHELAHVRRHDYLINLLQTVIETVFFYHPAIWWVSSQIRCERENCCDDVALQVVSRQTDYAKALVALEALRSRPPLMTVAASHGSLLMRIRRIVGINQEPKPGFAALLCAALVLAALAVGNMAAQTSEIPAATKTPAPAAAKDLLATAELNQNPYHVALPDGSVIALLGLGTSPTAGNHWWKPDGTPLAQTPPIPVPVEAWGLTHGALTVRGVALDARTQKGGTFLATVSGVTWYATPSLQSTSDGVYEKHRFVMGVTAKSSTSIFVNYFAKEWRTVGSGSGHLTQIDFPEGNAVFVSVSENDGTTESSVMYDVKYREVRVVAVDRRNVEHLPTLTIRDTKSRLIQSEFQGIAPHQISEFRFQIRDSRKIEFRNISLQPGQKTNVEIYIDGKLSVPQAVSSNERAELPAAAVRARPLETVTAVVAPSPVDPALDSLMYGRKLYEVPVLVTDGAGQPVAQATVVGCVNFQTTARTKSNSAGRAILKVPGDVIGKQDGNTWSVVETRPPRLQYVIAVKEDVGVDYFAYHDPGEPSHDPHVPPAPGAEPIKLVLQGTRSVRVQLKNANGQVVPLTRVSPVTFLLPGKWCPLPVPNSSRFESTTDGEGIATLQNLPANNQGKIRLCIDGGRRSDIVVSDEFAFDPAAPVEQIDAVVRRIPTSMGGSVCYPDGQLAPRAKVAISGLFADSDRAGWKTQQNFCDFEGHFWQGLEPNESYELSAWIGPFVSSRQTYVRHSGKPNAPVKLELQKGVRVHGRLTRGTGQAAVVGSLLTLYEGMNADDIRRRIKVQFPGSVRRSVADQPLQKHSRQTRTDDQGRFEFFVLPGTYYLEADAARPVGRENALFTITDPSEVEINFQLETPNLDGFDGVVVLKSDPKQPVKLGMVEGVSSEAVQLGDDFRASCDVQGKFKARRAPREMLVYAASADRSFSAIDRIPADAKNVVLAVGPTASVHGRLLDRDGHPLVNRVIEAGIPVKLGTFSNLNFVSRTTTRRRGEFVLENLTPGWRWEFAAAVTRGVGEQAYESREIIGISTPASAARVELGDLTLSTTESASPQEQTSHWRKPIFHPENDAKADIAAALAAAKREHKRVLLIWGTNWSSACYRLDEILNNDKETAAIVKKGFVPLPVDADANVKLLEVYGDRSWSRSVPFLTVLDSDGKLLINQWISDWGFSWYFLNPDVIKLQAFLLQWSPFSESASAAVSRRSLYHPAFAGMQRTLRIR